jgi:hypothetical protein
MQFFADHGVPRSVGDTLIGYLGQHPDQSPYVGKLFLVEVHRIRVRSDK